MAAMSVSEEDAKLVSQCLDLCQTLAGKSLAFSFSLTIRKKKSPSTLRRDARRREQFLRKKFDAPNAASSSHSEQAEAPVLKTPEKERLPPPISDRSLTPVLGEGREEPPSSASTPVAV